MPSGLPLASTEAAAEDPLVSLHRLIQWSAASLLSSGGAMVNGRCQDGIMVFPGPGLPLGPWLASGSPHPG